MYQCLLRASPFNTNLNPALENNNYRAVLLNYDVIKQSTPQILVKLKLLSVDTTYDLNHSLQGVSLALPLGDLVIQLFQMPLLFHVACANLILLFQIRRLILCHPCILANQQFEAFCQNSKFLLYSIVFLNQFPCLTNAVNQ